MGLIFFKKTLFFLWLWYLKGSIFAAAKKSNYGCKKRGKKFIKIYWNIFLKVVVVLKNSIIFAAA